MSVLASETPSQPFRSPRKDVIRHRAALMAAAARIFAERGMDVPLEEIASAAGVGRGTLYRHFPSRTDLVHALLDADLERLEKLTERVANKADGLFDLLRTMIEQSIAIMPLVDASRIDPDVFVARFVCLCAAPLQLARDARLVRADLDERDLLDLTVMAGSALKGRSFEERQQRGPRVYELIVEGLKHKGNIIR